MDKKTIGKLGEEKAAVYLSSKGYEILERNYGRYSGEIDIVALKDDILIFIEVKTRNSLNYGYAFEAVDHKKQEKIRNTSLLYLVDRGLEDYQLRYDLLEIYPSKGKINHIKNAF